MAPAASSESPVGSFFSADWYSPMDLIRSISGWGYDDPVDAEQSLTGPAERDPAMPSCCQPPSRKTIVLDKSGTPANMPQEESLREKVKQTLLDASLSGSLLAALADLEQPRSLDDDLSDSASSEQSEQTPVEVNEARTSPDEMTAAWEKFGQSLAVASKMSELRSSVSNVAVETAKTPDQREASESDGSDELAHHPFGIASERVATPMGYSASTSKDKRRYKDALTKSKRAEVSDVEQMELQAKTALLDDIRLAKVRVKSPRKGKRIGSPKKGGS